MYNRYKRFRIKYSAVRRVIADNFLLEGVQKSEKELLKSPERSEIINLLVASSGSDDPLYLEIGVRKPQENFDKIRVNRKYGVDPGVEFVENPVEFKLTSDEFFNQLREGKVLDRNIHFDVIFVDGLHTAEQTDRDIENALNFISDKGFIVLHDCNPPTEYHTRETYNYWASPAMDHWNGTSWKAFFKYRKRKDIYSCCVDTDWGVGIISKTVDLGQASGINNDFYEYSVFDQHRKESLNLLSFEELKSKLGS